MPRSSESVELEDTILLKWQSTARWHTEADHGAENNES